MKNSARLMVWVALALAACDDQKVADDTSAVSSAQLQFTATTPTAVQNAAQVPVVAWELSGDYEGPEDYALQDLTTSSGSKDRWQLTQTPPVEALETAAELLQGRFSLGYLALTRPGHAALVDNPFKDEESADGPVTLVAQNYAVIYVSEAQPAKSFVAGYYNAYRPLTAGFHLIHFRETTEQEDRQAIACHAEASAASLAEVNEKFHASYTEEDALYEEEGLSFEEQEARLSLYELSLDRHKIDSSCAIARAVGEEQSADTRIDLRAEQDEPFVNWD